MGGGRRGRARLASEEIASCFLPEFLRAAFAQVEASGCHQFRNASQRADVFGHTDQRDFLGAAANRFGGAGDSLLNAAEIIGDGHGE